MRARDDLDTTVDWQGAHGMQPKRFGPGDRIAGKYRIERVLGEGAVGTVFAAKHMLIKQRVAIKVIRPDAATPLPVLRQRFAREARAVMSLQSDHVVRIMDFGVEGESVFLVMEYLEGEDLSALITRRGPLPVTEAIDLVLQACAGVAEAHAHGVIHRDLKLANIFVGQRIDGSPLVKVLDFGISKQPALVTELSLTATTTVIGTPQYMSPEQMRSSKKPDPRSDIWSMGVILHRLLTAQFPFVGETFGALCAAIASDAPSRVGDYRQDVPAAIERIVSRCLEKSPADRFPTIAQLAAALAPFASPVARATAARMLLPTQASEVNVSPEPRAKMDSLPAASSSSAPSGFTGVLLSSKYWFMEEDKDRNVIFLRRTSLPFASIEELNTASAEAIACMHPWHARKGLVVDMREGPLGVDSSYEDAMRSLRIEVAKRFRRVALLMKTATGLLQASRLDRTEQVGPFVTRSEEEAVAFVRG